MLMYIEHHVLNIFLVCSRDMLGCLKPRLWPQQRYIPATQVGYSIYHLAI